MAFRILVVDDDELSREVLAVLIEDAGYEVEAADSGDAALCSMRSARPLPQVVLADMQMPGTSGDELARRMRGLCGTATMLLAISGSELEGDAGREFDGFLRKPFSMEALAAAIAGRAASTEPGFKAKAPVLDETVYAKLAASMPRLKLNQLYALCVDDVEMRIAKMRQAACDGEDGVYRREAHAIQGGCGMVGARQVQALAAAIEDRGLCDHLALLEKLMLACERLRRILVAHEVEGKEVKARVTGMSGEETL